MRDVRSDAGEPASAAAVGRMGPSGLFGAVGQHGFFALLDQAIVSGTNFATAVLIGRLSGAVEFGVYSLGLTALFCVTISQESLISLPYVVYGNRLHGTSRARYAGTALLHYTGLSLLAVACLAVLAAVLSMGVGPEGAAPAIWALAGVVPVVLLREFGRRMCFAHLHVVRAFVMDVLFATIQIGALLGLAATGALSAVTALLVMGIAAGTSGMGWLVVTRADFIVDWRQIVPELRRSTKLGRWDLAGQLTNWASRFGMYWVLALALDAKATGVFAACMTVVTLSNPFVLGIGNILGPQSARALASGGLAALWPITARATVIITVGMVAFSILVLLFGGEALVLLYGAEFGGNGDVAAVLALAVMAWAVGISAAHGLKVLERPDMNFKAGALGMGLTLLIALVLVGPLNVLGVAVASVAGRVAELLFRGFAFVRFVSPRGLRDVTVGHAASPAPEH